MTGDPPMLKSFPSAFQPPAVSKSLFSPGHNLFPGPRPPGLVSPASDHSSEPRSEETPLKADENCNTEHGAAQLLASPGADSAHGDTDCGERETKREYSLLWFCSMQSISDLYFLNLCRCLPLMLYIGTPVPVTENGLIKHESV